MCGLSGFARTDGGALAPDADTVLRRMALALAHRGPDDEQILCESRAGRVGLAFTRLALLDPAGGRQPFVTDDGNVALVANGEVYNYRELTAALPAGVRLRSRSDCEVLLPLYLSEGLDFLRRARGMFAVAIYDARRESLILARDRLGIKPLFFHRDRERIVFASEIKALFEYPGCPRRLDWPRALADQALGAAPVLTDEPPTTWFEDIEQVAPGTAVEIDLRTGQTREHRYWRLPDAQADSDESDAGYAERYRELLAASVDECLIADAEIGLFLSGGIDSATVAALAAGTGLHTFSALAASTVANGDAEHAALTAARLGLPNHQVLFPADRVPGPAEWKRLLWLLETPQCGPEQFYKHELHRFAKMERPGLKAILLGAGADELNGGYTVELSGGGDWSDFIANLRTMARRRILSDRPASLATWWDGVDLPLLTDAALHAGLDSALADPYAAYLAWKCRDMQQYNFWHEDRTGAGNAIEARVPFLDHRIVELLAAIPAARRAALLWNKQILRTAAADLVPAEIAHRPKVGFYEGDGAHHTYRMFVRMLGRQGDALLDEAFSAPGARLYVDEDNARATLRRLERNPRASHVEHLLRVVNLGLLELLAAAPPEPTGTDAIGEPLRSLDVVDWAGDRERVQLMTVGQTDLADTRVPRLGEDVMVLDAPAEDRTSYVVIQGSLEYVVDAETDRSWLDFLRAVDGTRPLGLIVAEVGCDVEEIRSLIEEAVALGILTFAPSAEPSRPVG